MNSRGSLKTILIILFIILILAAIYLIPKMDLNNEIKAENSIDSGNCSSNEECFDSDSCTIDFCNKGICSNVDVILCYQGDNCCPSGCTSQNDGDC